MKPSRKGRDHYGYKRAPVVARRQYAPSFRWPNRQLHKSLLLAVLFITVVSALLAYNASRIPHTPARTVIKRSPPGDLAFKDVSKSLLQALPKAERTTEGRRVTYNMLENVIDFVREDDNSEGSSEPPSAARTLINGRINISRRTTSGISTERSRHRGQSTMILIRKAKLDWVARNTPFPLDDFRDKYVNGHRVRKLCRSGKVETLFFFHTDPKHANRRDFYRSTLGHSSLESMYKWTVVFFVGTRPGLNLTLEGSHNGDLVQLPFLDTYRNLTYKFVYGMRWVLLNCPRVQTIVKLDDDAFVHVPVLDNYLRRYMNTREMSIHCSVFKYNVVVREPNSRHYLSRTEYPKKAFPPHCHGWAAIFPAWVMFPLYSAAFRVPVYGIDDAYVTGDLALAAGVGHRDISVLMSDTEENILEAVQGQYIFALYSGNRKLNLRKALWKTMARMRHEREVEIALDKTLQ